MIYLEVLGLTLLAVLLYDGVRLGFLKWKFATYYLHYRTTTQWDKEEIFRLVIIKMASRPWDVLNPTF